MHGILEKGVKIGPFDYAQGMLCFGFVYIPPKGGITNRFHLIHAKSWEGAGKPAKAGTTNERRRPDVASNRFG